MSMLESGSQLGKYLGSALLLSASPQTVADPELTGVEEEPVEVKPGEFSWEPTAIAPWFNVWYMFKQPCGLHWIFKRFHLVMWGMDVKMTVLAEHVRGSTLLL